MIISENREPSLEQFYSLICETTSYLNIDAKKRSEYYMTRHAQLLEDDVKDSLSLIAKGTSFEGTIKKISGQRFPDIVAGKYYGIEVKSSKDDKWITLGGSVNESTRVKGVERIFLTFGKLIEPVEFRSRPYESCLSDVVVTHYPRYKIDMNITDGKTIFDKMNTTYDDLRFLSDPVGEIVNYYKEQLNDGESLWWTGKVNRDSLDATLPVKIRLWKTLTAEEKKELRNMGFALFPDLLCNSTSKYERFTLWLVATHGIVSTSTRDSFTAGGRGKIETTREIFKNVPRVLINIHKNSAKIALGILCTDENILRETWQVSSISEDRIGQWISCVTKQFDEPSNDINAILNAIFNRK